MVDEDNVLGFLCGSESDNQVLITIIDDEEVVLTLAPSKNVVDAEPIVYTKYNSREKLSQECRLVVVNQQQMYSNRFYPRTYYTIFKLQLLPGILDQYILEQSNGTTGYTAFYPCSSYWECRKKIAELEDLDLEED